MDYLGGVRVAGGKLKEIDTTHWISPNSGATNETGFTALPGGARGTNGTFISIGNYGYCWSAAEYDTYSAGTCDMDYGGSYLGTLSGGKEGGFSVRCVRE